MYKNSLNIGKSEFVIKTNLPIGFNELKFLNLFLEDFITRNGYNISYKIMNINLLNYLLYISTCGLYRPTYNILVTILYVV